MEDVKRAIDAYGNNMVARKEYTMSLVIKSLLQRGAVFRKKVSPHHIAQTTRLLALFDIRTPFLHSHTNIADGFLPDKTK